MITHNEVNWTPPSDCPFQYYTQLEQRGTRWAKSYRVLVNESSGLLDPRDTVLLRSVHAWLYLFTPRHHVGTLYNLPGVAVIAFHRRRDLIAFKLRWG